ncbi:MAG: DUF4176 domain-containing protein [Lachnospiraceae bacterium]|nr:DUF4176 domain-containing protein [Lachnospiraceae bacterium]
MKRNQYLPMGTVVQLNDQDNKVMICGRQQIDLETNEAYDYIGCEYPYGLDGENAMLFNGEQIQLVYFLGYQDMDELHYRYQLIGEETLED